MSVFLFFIYDMDLEDWILTERERERHSYNREWSKPLSKIRQGLERFFVWPSLLQIVTFFYSLILAHCLLFLSSFSIDFFLFQESTKGTSRWYQFRNLFIFLSVIKLSIRQTLLYFLFLLFLFRFCFMIPGQLVNFFLFFFATHTDT